MACLTPKDGWFCLHNLSSSPFGLSLVAKTFLPFPVAACFCLLPGARLCVHEVSCYSSGTQGSLFVPFLWLQTGTMPPRVALSVPSHDTSFSCTGMHTHGKGLTWEPGLVSGTPGILNGYISHTPYLEVCGKFELFPSYLSLQALLPVLCHR